MKHNTTSHTAGLFVGLGMHIVGLYVGGVLGMDAVSNIYSAAIITVSLVLILLFGTIAVGYTISATSTHSYNEAIKIRNVRPPLWQNQMSRVIIAGALLGQAALGWYWTFAMLLILQVISWWMNTIVDDAIQLYEEQNGDLVVNDAMSALRTHLEK